jgi:septal ring factor EnvC (AmiA/AmiB activator)
MTKLRAGSFLVLPFTGLFCLILSFYSAADNHQKAELEELKRSILTLQNQLKNQRQEKNQLQNQIENVEIDAAKLNRSIGNLTGKIKTTTKQLKVLQDKKIKLSKRIDEQRSAIAEQIRAAHKTGAEEPIKLLLNQQDPQLLARNLKYYDYLLQARSQNIKQFTDDINQLEITAEAIKKTSIGLAKSKKSLEADRKNLAASVQKRKTILYKLDKSLKSGNEQLANYQKQQEHLETVVNAVKKAAATIAPAKNYPSFISDKGKLSWPVKGKLSHSFGSPRGGDLHWDGWLISASSGAEVRAIHPGRVVFSDYLRGFGLLVIIDHGDDFMSLYAHSQELMRETGDWVQSGQIISRAGNSGGLTDTALYFEIREKGIPVNPKIWLGKR